MTDIICSDPDHDSRKAQPGWAAVLGTTDLKVAPSGYLCDACAQAARDAHAETEAVLAALAINQATMQQYLATALPQLRTLLTQATAMKAANVTSIAQAQAQVRATGAALEAVITGAIKFARLLSNTLDGTT